MKTRKVLIEYLFYIVISFLLLNSCKSDKNELQDEDVIQTNSYNVEPVPTERESYYSSNNSDNEDNVNINNGCKFEDGNYSATVNYSNSETNYSATYNLDVEVQNCMVIQINFPNDGYLDEDHISPAEIDDNGNVLIEGEDGKSYEIQIEN